MSPRNLGGRYRCHPHPRSRKCAYQFLRETERVNRTTPRLASSAWRHRRWSCGVFIAHCPFQQKWRVLHSYDISALEQVGMSFNGIAYLMKAFVQAEVLLYSVVLITWISNVRPPAKQTMDFMAVKSVSVKYNQIMIYVYLYIYSFIYLFVFIYLFLLRGIYYQCTIVLRWI